LDRRREREKKKGKKKASGQDAVVAEGSVGV
jgi:hypothetical protein